MEARRARDGRKVFCGAGPRCHVTLELYRWRSYARSLGTRAERVTKISRKLDRRDGSYAAFATSFNWSTFSVRSASSRRDLTVGSVPIAAAACVRSLAGSWPTTDPMTRQTS